MKLEKSHIVGLESIALQFAEKFDDMTTLTCGKSEIFKKKCGNKIKMLSETDVAPKVLSGRMDSILKKSLAGAMLRVPSLPIKV